MKECTVFVSNFLPLDCAFYLAVIRSFEESLLACCPIVIRISDDFRLKEYSTQ